MVDETDGGSPRVGEGERAVEGGVCDGVVVEAEPVGSGGLVRGVEEEVGGGDAGGDVVGDQRQHALNGVFHTASLACHRHVGGLSERLELHSEAGEEEVRVLRPQACGVGGGFSDHDEDVLRERGDGAVADALLVASTHLAPVAHPALAAERPLQHLLE